MTYRSTCPPLLLAGLLAGLGACQSGPGTAPRENPEAYSDRRATDPATPLELTILREDAIETLQQAAVSEDAQQRANAVEAFSFVPSRAADVCRAALVDKNLAVRFVAAMTAGKLGDPALRAAVEPLLRDPSPEVRAAAVYADRALGGHADPTGLSRLLLAAPKIRQRAQAAYILGEMGDPSALALLRDAAASDPSVATLAELRLFRLQIAEAMAKLGDTGAIETVRAALYPSRPEELEAAALAAQILGEIGDRRSIDQLIYLIERDGADRMPAEIRLAAAGALAKLGEPGGAFVADEYVGNENPALRAQAASVYGLIGRPEGAPALKALLQDENPLVRVAAAAAIVRLHAE